MKLLEKQMNNMELDKLLNCLLIFDGGMKEKVMFKRDINQLINIKSESQEETKEKVVEFDRSCLSLHNYQ
jgi:hypothetical protein